MQKNKEFMGDIAEEIDRENKIINDLLTLVKLDKTKGELNIENVTNGYIDFEYIYASKL